MHGHVYNDGTRFHVSKVFFPDQHGTFGAGNQDGPDDQVSLAEIRPNGLTSLNMVITLRGITSSRYRSRSMLTSTFLNAHLASHFADRR